MDRCYVGRVHIAHIFGDDSIHYNEGIGRTIKEFKNKNNTRSLSFASQKDLNEILNLNPGSVSPFGLLNDKELKVKFFIDKSFMMDKYIIGVHPNDNTATVWLNVMDLIEIINEHGNEINIVEI